MLDRPPPDPPAAAAERRRARRRAAQARWRARSRTCEAVYPVPLDAADLAWLVDGVRYLDEASANDKNCVADAVHRLLKDAQAR